MSCVIQPAQKLAVNFQPNQIVFYTAMTQAGYNTAVTIADETGKVLATFQGSGSQKIIGQGSFVASTGNVYVTVTGNTVVEKAMVQDFNVVNSGTNYLTGAVVVTEDATDSDYNDLTLVLWANSRNG